MPRSALDRAGRHRHRRVGNGTSELPGVHSGANGAGARGRCSSSRPPSPRTTSRSPKAGPSPSPYDPTDAVYAAARLLCADGASGGADLPAAIFAYNHDTAYVAKVLALAQSFGQVTPAPARPALGTVRATGRRRVGPGQVGTPYIWGGETPGVGFDCSGLTQAAYQVAGIAIPRVAQDQFDAWPALPPGTELEPGDLVFFGSGPRDVSHVGIYLGVRVGPPMVDAPHTGADVRWSVSHRARGQVGRRDLRRGHPADRGWADRGRPAGRAPRGLHWRAKGSSPQSVIDMPAPRSPVIGPACRWARPSF